MVIFRKNGEAELKIGNLAIGNLGMLYVIGMDERVYGLSLLNMIQVYPYEQKYGWDIIMAMIICIKKLVVFVVDY